MTARNSTHSFNHGNYYYTHTLILCIISPTIAPLLAGFLTSIYFLGGPTLRYLTVISLFPPDSFFCPGVITSHQERATVTCTRGMLFNSMLTTVYCLLLVYNERITGHREIYRQVCWHRKHS